ATVTQPVVMGGITASVSVNVACRGNSTGIATVSSIAGGGTPFTYLWTGGQTNLTATGLSAGIYTVSVNDACGSSASTSVTVTQPATAVSVTANTVTNVTCNGQSQG